MHLSIHVERTGGTSLLAEYEKFYGSDRVLLYSADRDQVIRASDIPISPANESLSKLKALLERTIIVRFIYRLYVSFVKNSDDVLLWHSINDIPKNVDVIHGHYRPDRFTELIPVSFTSIVLREPLERMVSQYLHWQRAGGNMGFRIRIPYDSEMPFEEYAFQEEFTNFQTRALGSMDLNDFDLVGITPRLDRFIAWIIKKPFLEDFEVTKVNYLAHKPKYKELGITPYMIEKFKEINAEDYQNYRKAVELAI